MLPLRFHQALQAARFAGSRLARSARAGSGSTIQAASVTVAASNTSLPHGSWISKASYSTTSIAECVRCLPGATYHSPAATTSSHFHTDSAAHCKRAATLPVRRASLRLLHTTTHAHDGSSSSSRSGSRSSSTNSSNTHRSAENRRVAQYAVAVVIFTIGLGYAAVPLYAMFCRQTGYGGTVQERSESDLNEAQRRKLMKPTDRELTITFASNVGAKMHWDFKPTQPSIKLHVGEPALAFFTAKNNTDKPITGVATYNVAPMKAGLYFHKVQCFCVSEGTIISLPNGLGVAVEDSVDVSAVLSYNEADDGVISNAKQDLLVQGVKECVSLTLEDGRVLQCTADHQVLTASGWKQVGELSLNDEDDAVLCGIDVVADRTDDEQALIESQYVIHLQHSAMRLDMATWHLRQRTLAFARLAGLLLSDGSAHTHSVNHVTNIVLLVGHQLDVDAVMADLQLLGLSTLPAVRPPSGTKHNNNVYQIILPEALSLDLLAWTGSSAGGKRVSFKPSSLPSFATSSLTPTSVKREFLAAYFGGDGGAPCLSAAKSRHGTRQYWFDSVTFYQVVNRQWQAEGVAVMQELNDLMHQLFDTSLGTVDTVRATKSAHIELRLHLSANDTLLFAERVGFRYNCHKQMRLTIAAAWYRLQDSVQRHRRLFRDRVAELVDWDEDRQERRSETVKLADAVRQVKREFAAVPVISMSYMPKIQQVINLKQSVRALKVSAMPAIPDWLASIGAADVFSDPDLDEYSIRYGVSRNRTTLPVFYLKAVHVAPAGQQPTYDISVQHTHNFLANGCVVHNCFDEQRLRPNEQVDMPVFFYIDPSIEDDPKMKNVSDIVLSYTFWPMDNEDEDVDVDAEVVEQRESINALIAENRKLHESQGQFAGHAQPLPAGSSVSKSTS